MTSRPGFISNLTITYAGRLVDPGRSIRRARTTCQMTQEELAKKADISTSYLSRIELNRCEAPTRVYQRLAEAMGMRMDQVWGF